MKGHELRRLSLSILAPFLVLVAGCGHLHPPREQAQTSSIPEQNSTRQDFGTPETSDYLADESNGQEESVPLTTRALLAEARNLTIAGLEHYRNKEFDDAKLALDNAIIKLMDSDIPDDLKVPALLGVNLPESFREYDLVRIVDQLETLAGDDQLKDDDTYIDCQIRRISLSFGEPFPDEENLKTLKQEIHRYIRYFQTEGRDFYTSAYMRMPKYWPMIAEVFKEKGLPEDLIYKAFIESGFKCKAYSRAHARGIWQFIPATGKRYGLRISRGIDERLDPLKSSIAAREYMLDLIGIFGSKSFFLAMAAYNAGEHKISNCLRTLDNPFKDRTFWHIRNCLARETREYIPKILAVAMIAKDPPRFGFTLPSLEDMDLSFDVVIIPRTTSLSKVASDLGLSTAIIRDLNPDIPEGSSQTPVDNFPIYIPKDVVVVESNFTQTLENFVASLDTTTILTSEMPRELEPTQDLFEYVFQAGNTLSQLAQWFNVSEQRIRDLNPDKGYPGCGDTLVIPAGDPPIVTTDYRIRSGDNLQKIARLFGVDFRALAAWNGLLHPYRINVGRLLKIYAPRIDSEGRPTDNQIVYTVKKGNYLYAVAEVFDVSYQQIMSQNQLKQSRLFPGQKLFIKTTKPVYEKTHVVRSGDALPDIAKNYGVSVKDVMIVNGLSDYRVSAGQKLIIYTAKP